MPKVTLFEETLVEVPKSYSNKSEYNYNRKMTVDFWVKFDDLSEMPIPISFGAWGDSGWFVQCLGGGWRWHISGTDCDGGRPELGKWHHIVATYDGKYMRLWQDDLLVAERPVAISYKPGGGDRVIGQYSAGAADQYKFKGEIKDVKILNYVDRVE